MARQYVVKQPFEYGGKQYNRGDTWEPQGGKWDNLMIANQDHVVPMDVVEASEDKYAGKRVKQVIIINATKGAIDHAAEHDIDLAEVSGSGDAGRIVKPDVVAYLEAQEV